MSVDGVRLHVVELGEGDPVVLLHGNGSAADELLASGLVDRLARRNRVVLIERPGFGYSTRPGGGVWTPSRQARVLARAFQVLDLDRPVVFGHSFGAMVAAVLALDHPQAVGAVVLASGYYYPTPRLDVAVVSGPAIPIIGPILAHTISPLVARLAWPHLLAKIFSPQPVAERFRHSLPAGMALRPGPLQASAEEAAVMIPTALHFSERWPQIRVPVVIIAGMEDAMVDPDRQSVALYHAVRGARLHLVARAGHMVHYAAPERVADAIAEAHLLSLAAAGKPARSRLSAVAH